MGASGEILRRPLRQTNAKDITAKVGAPLPGSCAEDDSPPAAEKPSSYATGNLFCVEGSQVRSGPCRKIMNPPGGRSSSPSARYIDFFLFSVKSNCLFDMI